MFKLRPGPDRSTLLITGNFDPYKMPRIGFWFTSDITDPATPPTPDVELLPVDYMIIGGSYAQYDSYGTAITDYHWPEHFKIEYNELEYMWGDGIDDSFVLDNPIPGTFGEADFYDMYCHDNREGAARHSDSSLCAKWWWTSVWEVEHPYGSCVGFNWRPYSTSVEYPYDFGLDGPEYKAWRVSARVRTNDPDVDRYAQYVWTDCSYLYQGEYWVFPDRARNTPTNIPFTIEVTQYVQRKAEIVDIDGCTDESYCGTGPHKIWCPYSVARDADWMPDKRLRVTIEPAPIITIKVTVGDGTHGYETAKVTLDIDPDMMGRFYIGTPFEKPAESDKQIEMTIIRDGAFANIDFGQAIYVDSSFQQVIQLDSHNLTLNTTATAVTDGLDYWVLACYTGSSQCSMICAALWCDRMLCYTNHGPNATFEWTDYASEEKYTSDTGAFQLSRPGWWKLIGIDELTATDGPEVVYGVAENIDPTIYDDDGEYRRRYGPWKVTNVREINQPQFDDKPGYPNSAYEDCRVLMQPTDEPASQPSNLLSITPYPSCSRDVVAWKYAQHAALCVTNGVTLSEGTNGELIATWSTSSGTLSIEYDDCRISSDDAIRNWLGVRYATIRVTAPTDAPYTLQIAGRTYHPQPDNNRNCKSTIDLLYTDEDYPEERTQSLLPVFQPFALEPPQVDDIPLDWGIYEPGTITISGCRPNVPYKLSGITLKRFTSIKVLILPESNWSGNEPDQNRDPESDPRAFFAAGDDVFCQRAGCIICDGVVSHELLTVKYVRELIDSEYTWTTELIKLQAESKAIFPVDSTPFVKVDVGMPPTYGIGEEGAVDAAWLKNGMYLVELMPFSMYGLLTFSEIDVPANYGILKADAFKYYGGVACIRTAGHVINQTRRLTVAGTVNGTFSADALDDGTLYTWQFNPDKDSRVLEQGEYTAKLLTGIEHSSTGAARNRLLTFELLKVFEESEAALGDRMRHGKYWYENAQQPYKDIDYNTNL